MGGDGFAVSGLRGRRPNRFTSAFYRVPLVLWRMGLAPLLGRFTMVLTTMGRKSGRPRHVMVERHVANGKLYALSGYGKAASWYRNVVADPLVTVQTADGVYTMRARRVVDTEEIVAFFDDLARRHPRTAALYLRPHGVEYSPDSIAANAERIYLIAFDPADEPGPPPMPADLRRVWPIALAIVLAARLVRRGLIRR